MASLTAAFLALSFGERALVCAFATLLINLSAAQCTLCMVSHRASAAASYGVVVILLGAVNVVGYSSDSRLLVPIVIAGWIGTFLAVRYASPAFAPTRTPALDPGREVMAALPGAAELGGTERSGPRAGPRPPAWATRRVAAVQHLATSIERPAFRLTQRLRCLLS